MGLSYQFDWSVLWRHPYGIWLLKGLGLTIGIGLAAWVIALSLGITIGTLRITRYRMLRLFGTAYVEILRNIPLLVQMFFWFYAGPMLFGETLAREIEESVPDDVDLKETFKISGYNILLGVKKAD